MARTGRRLLSVVFAVAGVARADVRLPAIVGDNMVLQRESEVALWGFADPGEAVRVKGDWMTSDASAVAAADGLWLVRVRTPEAGGPHTITFGGKNTITLRNVLVGEVWICSGQSNMEWSVGPGVGPGVANFEAEVRTATFPKIRLFDVKNTVAAAPAKDCVGSWVECSPQTVVPFSAVGYFFGRMLHRELGVPIGLIASNWGGTVAEAWTSARTLRGFSEFANALALMERVREHGSDLRAEVDLATQAWWKHVDESDSGSRGAAFAKPDVDDSDWKTLDLPGVWDDVIPGFDGVVWFRRTFDLPADWADADLVLDLGPIDDVDDAWVGGVRVGGLHGEGDHATPREYAVPAAVARAGRNVIAIRAIDTGGAGGLTGKPEQLRLRRATSDGSAISLAGSWHYWVGASMAELGPRPRLESIGPNTPTALYNGMIAPLIPFGIRGAIWYQGESNVSEAHLYRRLFPAMIADWRASFGAGDFPFYFVQIAPFAYRDDLGEAAELREAQAMTTSVANTGMAVTLDIGNPTNIHPSNKQEVGRRLALLAFANTYGRKGAVTSGPSYTSMSVEGSAIRLRFDHADGGLRARGGQPLGPFTIAGADRKFVPATAQLDGATIVVSSPDVAAPAAVRFAWGAADEGTLENGAGLPSSSFRTDDWPSLTQHPPPRIDVADRSRLPDVLSLDAPIDTWDEALPLGNGLCGALLWGSGNTIRLSLDRGDLWDGRTPPEFTAPDWNYATMRRLVADKDQATMQRLFDTPYEACPYPTKIPGGRLELTLDPSQQLRRFDLDLRAAEATVLTSGREIRAFFSAAQPVALMRFSLPPTQLKLVRPASLDKLGYGRAEEGRDRDTLWMVQRAALGLTYAVVAGMKRQGSGSIVALAITSTNDAADPLAEGRARVQRALDAGYDAMLQPHVEWWSRFWASSEVHIPDPAMQAHYDFVKYLYGAGSRAGAPPMPLQGVWSADAGDLPPWKGDYHNDLNTQMTYLATHTAGLDESGQSFLDFYWKLLPSFRDFARRFYGTTGGAVVPGVMSLDGKPLGGWAQYALSPTMGAWVAQSFYLHWRYTRDERFLRERAYPFCAEIGQALVELLKPDENEMLRLPLSTSPEIFDNSMKAWLPPNSNFDLALLHFLIDALVEMAHAMGNHEEMARWLDPIADLEALDVDEASGSLTFARGVPVAESHRHFSHAVAIHPLGVLNVEGSERDAAIVHATLDRILDEGTSAWCGYSFSWMACLLARAGRPEQALDHLEKYRRAFTLRNGFHANGDQTRSGLSSFTYRPVTLEGNFLAMEAVHEMLLQSWGVVVRVFPAVSVKWRDVSFTDLRAEGGFRVTATRRAGATTSVSVTATHDGVLRLQDPFAGSAPEWNRPDVKKVGRCYEAAMKAGETLAAHSVAPSR